MRTRVDILFGCTYIQDILNLSQDCRNRLSNKWNGLEETCFPDHNIQELLCRCYKLEQILLAVRFVDLLASFYTVMSLMSTVFASFSSFVPELLCLWAIYVVAVETISVSPVIIVYDIVSTSCS